MGVRSIPLRVVVVLAGVLVVRAPPSRAQTTERASLGSAGEEGDGTSYFAVISRDARYVAFASGASNFDPADTNGIYDVYRHDRVTGTTVRVSVDSSGVEADGPSTPYGISDDGNLVLFISKATNLVPGDTNQYDDAFVRDVAAGSTERVSVDSSGNGSDGHCFDAAISGDGRYVVFSDDGTNLVTGDHNFTTDVFLRDRSTGTTTRVSVSSNGSEANNASLEAAISRDGSFVVFESFATNLVGKDPYSYLDIFMRDVAAGTTSQISLRHDGGRPAGDSWTPTISDSGDRVAFISTASDLVAGDHSGWDVFVRDVPAATNLRASLSSTGDEPNQNILEACISGDGAFVAFVTGASNLVEGDVNGWEDVFVRSFSNSMTTLESVSNDGVGANWNCGRPALSADGGSISFESLADNLVANDSNALWDVFVRSRVIAAASATGYGTGYAGTNGVPSFTARSVPVLNTAEAIDIGNSSGAWSLAFVVIGASATDVATNRGGHLLVVPTLILVLPLSPTGAALDGIVPPSEELAGLPAYFQVFETDPGALYGFSFSAALELVFGY
jgi:hypothetical protein